MTGRKLAGSSNRLLLADDLTRATAMYLFAASLILSVTLAVAVGKFSPFADCTFEEVGGHSSTGAEPLVPLGLRSNFGAEHLLSVV